MPTSTPLTTDISVEARKLHRNHTWVAIFILLLIDCHEAIVIAEDDLFPVSMSRLIQEVELPQTYHVSPGHFFSTGSLIPVMNTYVAEDSVGLLHFIRTWRMALLRKQVADQFFCVICPGTGRESSLSRLCHVERRFHGSVDYGPVARFGAWVIDFVALSQWRKYEMKWQDISENKVGHGAWIEIVKSITGVLPDIWKLQAVVFLYVAPLLSFVSHFLLMSLGAMLSLCLLSWVPRSMQPGIWNSPRERQEAGMCRNTPQRSDSIRRVAQFRFARHGSLVINAEIAPYFEARGRSTATYLDLVLSAPPQARTFGGEYEQHAFTPHLYSGVWQRSGIPISEHVSACSIK